jgi:GNAT superfamily N-acetyltransferase
MGEYQDSETIAKFNIAMAWETEKKKLELPIVSKGVQTLLDNPRHGFYVVAEVEGEVVGSLMVTYEWSDWRCSVFWWIQSVYVKPQFRKQGIFRSLYEFLKDKASQEQNICGFRLYAEKSNDTAHNTYGSVGMKEAPYKFYEELFEQ